MINRLLKREGTQTLQTDVLVIHIKEFCECTLKKFVKKLGDSEKHSYYSNIINWMIYGVCWEKANIFLDDFPHTGALECE